jgi:hypothetical protein
MIDDQHAASLVSQFPRARTPPLHWPSIHHSVDRSVDNAVDIVIPALAAVAAFRRVWE